jgi:predicted membrane channel-forming protein YqfA (hemolysin III family)
MNFRLNKANALPTAIIGLILSIPFIYVTWFQPGASLLGILSLMLFIVGGPIFLIGVVMFFSKPMYGRYISTTHSDLSRIRFLLEQERINKYR